MDKLKILLAKGRIYESVYELLSDVGISIHLPDRTYFPTTNQKDLAFQVLATCYSDPEIAAILRKPVDAEEEGSWEERMERLKDVDITKAPLFGFSVSVDKAEYPAANYMSEHVISSVLIELFGANYYSPNRTVNPVYHELDFTNEKKSLSYPRLIEEYRRQLGEFRKKQNSGS